MIQGEGIDAVACRDIKALAVELDRGPAVLIVAGELFLSSSPADLVEIVRRQERTAQSGLPLIVILDGETTDSEGTSETLLDHLATIRSISPVLLAERPFRAGNLRSLIEAADAIRQGQDQVRELARKSRDEGHRRDQFLAMLDHELRNPLAAVRNAIQLLRPKLPDGEEVVQECTHIIDKQTKRLMTLLDQLVDARRVTLNQIELQKSPQDLARVVHNAIRTLVQAKQVASPSTRFVIHKPAEPVMVLGDPVRLEQIVVNLLTNALQSTECESRVEIRIESRADTEEAILIVRDDGIGLSSEQLSQIFEPFIQPQVRPQRSPGGFGIGLTLARSLLDLHKGHIEATSPGLGLGAEFVVRLPWLKPSQERSGTGTAASEKQVSGTNSLRVALVEDNQDNRRTMAMILEMWGHEVDQAEDGLAGLNLILDRVPDVALIDIGLPGLDGYGVARQVRAHLGQRVRLIALTGYGQPDDRLRAFEAGFDSHLIKPVELDIFESVLQGQETPQSHDDWARQTVAEHA
jgi:signal transduction histidine kinase/ActR/RegA family two-component response regulator